MSVIDRVRNQVGFSNEYGYRSPLENADQVSILEIDH